MSSNVLLNSTCDEQDQKWGGLAPGSSVLVQGGSRGLGLAFVQFLLEQPECTQCFVSARNPTHSEALQQLQQQHPERLHLLSVELEDPQSIDRMCAQVQEHTSTLHMLLNVAGILHEGDELWPEKRLQDLQWASFQKSFAINTWAPLWVIRGLAPLFFHGEPAVVACLSARVGSISDNRLGGWYSYRASKAAQNMMLKTASIELRRKNKQLICLSLHPGTVDTQLSEPFQRSVPPEKLFTPQHSRQLLWNVICDSSPADTGSFLAWDGSPIPW